MGHLTYLEACFGAVWSQGLHHGHSLSFFLVPHGFSPVYSLFVAVQVRSFSRLL